MHNQMLLWMSCYTEVSPSVSSNITGVILSLSFFTSFHSLLVTRIGQQDNMKYYDVCIHIVEVGINGVTAGAINIGPTGNQKLLLYSPRPRDSRTLLRIQIKPPLHLLHSAYVLNKVPRSRYVWARQTENISHCVSQRGRKCDVCHLSLGLFLHVFSHHFLLCFLDLFTTDSGAWRVVLVEFQELYRIKIQPNIVNGAGEAEPGC